MLPRNTSTCRQRRSTIRAMNPAALTAVTPQPDPATLIPWATSLSHGVRARANVRSTDVPARALARRSAGTEEEAIEATTIATATVTHRRVVQAMVRGRGGGAPVGRRCRRVR